MELCLSKLRTIRRDCGLQATTARRMMYRAAISRCMYGIRERGIPAEGLEILTCSSGIAKALIQWLEVSRVGSRIAIALNLALATFAVSASHPSTKLTTAMMDDLNLTRKTQRQALFAADTHRLEQAMRAEYALQTERHLMLPLAMANLDNFGNAK